MNHNRKDRMKGNFGFGKRLLSTALAAAMAATAMGTQAFAQPEATDESAEIQHSRVVSWSWPEEVGLDWSEEDQVWLLSCVYSEDQPLTEETLTQLLPGQITAVVQAPSVSQPESTPVAPAQEEPAVVDTDTVEDLTVVEENVSTFETAATLDTAASDEGEEDPGSVESTDEVTSEEMGEATLGTVDAAPQTLSLNLTWDFSGIQFPVQPGDYTFSASLPQGYQLDQNALALKVKLSVSAAAVMMANEITPRQVGNVISSTVSPVGTTINLFDYWLTSRDDPDNVNPNYVENCGINNGHTLQFRNTTNGTGVNNWTGDSTPRSGIVKNLLENGYPTLKVGSGESLSYLFDTNSSDYKEAFPNVKGLLQVDNDNYYYYDSQKNYAQYDEDTESFQLWDTWGITHTGTSAPNGQFFPFDKNEEWPNIQNVKSSTAGLNHYFGLTMTTRFIQMEGGHNQGKVVTYEFSGDDDVWVFIDDVLVGDLGGIHDAASLKIDFSTGDIFINNQVPDPNENPRTLKEAFENAGKPWNNEDSDTFADNTYHTLKFFYLERGNNDSNMKLKFNLVSIPQSDLIKVDQTGDPVPNATFGLYYSESTTEDYTKDVLIATGTTDEQGQFVFTKDDGTLLSLNDLYETYGGNKGTGKFVLSETDVPDGYRSSGDVHLYFPDEISQAILLSDNAWETGAYAMPMLTATLPEQPQASPIHGNGETIPSPGENGFFFAVVMKKDGDNWYPVSGDPLNGWQVHKPADGGEVKKTEILAAAQKTRYVFQLDSSGQYKVTIEDLPGDIQTYYYMLLSNPGNDAATSAEYTVAYYYCSDESLDTAQADDIVPLNSNVIDNNSPSYFEREFSVRLYVPNIKNVLVVQKVSDNDTPLIGAQFTLTKKTTDGSSWTDTVTTTNLSEDNGDIITLDGGAVFPSEGNHLSEGTYILKESNPPTGYTATEQEIKIIVDSTGVYADAGEPEDDVSVLRGAGNLVRSMVQFAAKDDIDMTLTDIVATLYTRESNSTPNYSPGTHIDSDYWRNWDTSSTDPLHLSYAASDHILDYGAAKGSALYFEVDSGWSSVKITQDFKDENLKQDLTDPETQEAIDLSNLFSRSTIVRVKNTPIGLTIKKVVADPVGTDAQNEFTIEIQLKNKDGPMTGKYHYLDSDEQKQELEFKQGKATIQLKHNQSITFIDLPDGTQYTVTEQNSNNYTPSYSVQVGDGQPSPGNSGTLSNGRETQTVQVTNTRKTGSVSISKTVTGNLGDKTKPFEFTLELKDGTTSVARTFTATGAQQSITFDQAGRASVQLSDGQNIAIQGLPVGATLTVTETPVTGYTTTVSGGTVNNSSSTVNIVENGSTVSFTNNCTIQPPTGLHGETRPYKAMVGLAGAAAVIGIAGWVQMRRRKRREQE